MILSLSSETCSGKSTQADALQKALGRGVILSSSAGLKAAAAKGVPGAAAVLRNEYVADEVMIPVMAELLDAVSPRDLEDMIISRDLEGLVIIDGYPRTVAQVDHLLTWLSEHGIPKKKVVALDLIVPVSVILKRALNRGRGESPESVLLRLRHEAEILPATLSHLQRLGVTVRYAMGTMSVPIVTARIREILKI